jgi:hypothetical protein
LTVLWPSNRLLDLGEKGVYPSYTQTVPRKNNFLQSN